LTTIGQLTKIRKPRRLNKNEQINCENSQHQIYSFALAHSVFPRACIDNKPHTFTLCEKKPAQAYFD